MHPVTIRPITTRTVRTGIETMIATGTSIFIVTGTMTETVTGVVDKVANAPTWTSGPRDDYDMCCQSASASLEVGQTDIDDSDAPSNTRRCVAGRKSELPPIGGPHRMIRIEGGVGDLNKPGTVAIDDEYRV